MPKKLMSCVKKVQAQGKSKSSSYAICVKSTGQKPHSHTGVGKKKKGYSY